MTNAAIENGERTYVPSEAEQVEAEDLVRMFAELSAARPASRPALVAADGTRYELPQAIFEAVQQVAEALSQGRGVTVASRNARLTTQQAADFLGISRPTFVRILERGELPMEKPGRHRFVRLQDLLDYQSRTRSGRRKALEDMVTEAEELGLYDTTDRRVTTR